MIKKTHVQLDIIASDTYIFGFEFMSSMLMTKFKHKGLFNIFVYFLTLYKLSDTFNLPIARISFFIQSTIITSDHLIREKLLKLKWIIYFTKIWALAEGRLRIDNATIIKKEVFTQEN